MPTGSPFFPLTQRASHWFSCGQTRPQTAGRELVRDMISYAFPKSPSLTCSIKRGISICTGQPDTQGLCLQLRQRVASSIAVSAL